MFYDKNFFMRLSSLRVNRIGCLVLFIAGIAACRKEAALQPDTINNFYTLPQGNHSYDDSIMDIYKKYGSYVLYDFTQQDLTYDYSRSIKVISTPANPDCIDTVLKFLKRECFDFYPDAFLKKTLPFKILLAASLDTANGNTVQNDYARSITGFVVSKNMMAVGWTDTTLFTTAYPKKQLRGWLNGAFIKQALLSGALTVPDEFLKYTPGSYTSILGQERQNGILFSMNAISLQDVGPAWDFGIYVTYITSMPKADFDNMFIYSGVDWSGKIALKYNAVVNYFQSEFGIDIQAIGDKD